jgi:hypothetical protein
VPLVAPAFVTRTASARGGVAAGAARAQAGAAGDFDLSRVPAGAAPGGERRFVGGPVSVVAFVGGDGAADAMPADAPAGAAAPAGAGATAAGAGATAAGAGPPISTWGWGSPATNNVYAACRIDALDRPKFLAFAASLPSGPRRNTPEAASAPLGATTSVLTDAVPPPIETTTVMEDGKQVFKLLPTHAEMPAIQSAITDAGEFVEGKAKFVNQNDPGLCASGEYPVRWKITPEGAARLRAGEQEHCDDFRYAFDQTLALYASGINNVAAAERRYSTRQQALDDVKQRTGAVDGAQMMREYIRLASLTVRRDTRWHTPHPFARRPAPPACEHLKVIGASSLPDVDQHPASEVLQPPQPPQRP